MKLRLMRAEIIGNRTIAVKLHRIMGSGSAKLKDRFLKLLQVDPNPMYSLNLTEIDFTNFVEHDDESEAHYSDLLMGYLKQLFNILDEKAVIYDRRGDFALVKTSDLKLDPETASLMRMYETHCMVQQSPVFHETEWQAGKAPFIPKQTSVTQLRAIAPLTEGIGRFKAKILLNIISNQNYENQYQYQTGEFW